MENKTWCWPLQDELGIKKDGNTTPKFNKVLTSLNEDNSLDEAELKKLMLKYIGKDEIKKPQEVTMPEQPTTIDPIIDIPFFESKEHSVARMLYKVGLNLYFFGPAGCGKTTFARMLAGDNNYYLVSCSTDMVPSHLIGHWEVQGDETRFVYGPLPRAMMEGKILILDEFDRVSEDVASKLHEVLESGQLLIEQTTDLIKADNSFKIIATGNSDMQGSVEYNTLSLDLASIDRFEFIVFSYSNKEKTILTNMGLEEETAIKLVDLANIIRQQDITSAAFSTRRLINITKMMLQGGMDIKQAVYYGFLSRLSPDEQKSIKHLEKMLGEASEVWVIDPDTPPEVIDRIAKHLSSAEAKLFRKTKSCLAKEELLTIKEDIKQYLKVRENKIMPGSGVSSDEFA